MVRGAVVLAVAGVVAAAPAAEPRGLTREAADRLAGLALRCVGQEYPHKLDHVMNGAAEVRGPKDLHPAFYGCFDWHSCVHGHWMLVRLLREHPDLARGPEIRTVLDAHLTPARIAVERAYLEQPNRRSFERTYGWAWLLKLAAELRTWEDPGAPRWSEALDPLARDFARRLEAFLKVQTYPIRTGVHPNTAFSLDLALDYAEAAGDRALERVIRDRALAWYGRDRNGPLAWEPGGEDFLSPCLEEAALMARVLEPRAFRAWLAGFLPDLAGLVPAVVADRTDPKIVHLDGLNLSRARALRRLAATLGASDPRALPLRALADRHEAASLPHLASGAYEGEHWLGTFAVRALAEAQGAGGVGRVRGK